MINAESEHLSEQTVQMKSRQRTIWMLTTLSIVGTASAELPEPWIAGLDVCSNRLSVGVCSQADSVLTVERSFQLVEPDWQSITTCYASDTNTVIDDYRFDPGDAAYYRVRIDAANLAGELVYHGWSNAVYISSGPAYAVIVPEIGRIMQFGLTASEGVFWANRSLDGVDASGHWQNFGGDKVWPAPQSGWSGGSWPPPSGFDGLPHTVHVANGEVVLTSPVDASYGIQVERHVRLFPGEARMRVTTVYNKVSGSACTIGAWTITQLQDPERLFFPVVSNSVFASGYRNMYATLPSDLAVSNGLVSFSRDTANRKVGSDGERMLWVGDEFCLEMSTPRLSGQLYPDSDCSLEIFTSGSSDYIELELLGPLTGLNVGDSLEVGVNYSLYTRNLADAQLEAERIFRLGEP